MRLKDLSIYLVIIFGVLLLTTHLLSFVTKNITLSSYLSLSLLTISAIIFRSKLKSIDFLPKFDFYEITTTAIAATIGVLMGLRDLYFGNPDNFHIPLTASIADNNFYPPIFPSTASSDMSNYHYGVDLIGAIFKNLFNLSVWDAHSLQIAVGAGLTVLTVFALIEHFIQRSKTSLILSIVAIFYTSITSLEFISREWSQILQVDLNNFLAKWLLVSWTSVSHMTSQLRLPSQNCALFFSFVLIILLAEFLEKHKANYLGIITCAFGIYFTFPAFYYPIVGAFIILFLIKSYSSLKSQVSGLLLVLAALYLAKFLTFTETATALNGIKALTLHPSLTWLNWGKAYLNYFYTSQYLSGLERALDSVYPDAHIYIPLFSSITFREFGFDALVSFIISGYLIYKKKYSSALILPISALLALAMPLVFEFIPRPIETTRFLHWTKLAFVTFNCIHIPILFTLLKEKLSKTWYLISSRAIILIICIVLVPGFVSVLPVQAFVFFGNHALNPSQKLMLTEIEKIHKSGDICLCINEFKHGHDITEIAAYFGVGGQIYKSDNMTRLTAVRTLNPLLLQELKVDYVLLDSSLNALSPIAASRLGDPKLFTEVLTVNQASPNYHFYKFNAKSSKLDETEKILLKSEYVWVLGCDIAKEFKPLSAGNPPQYIFSDNRQDLIKIKENIRKQIAQINPVCAMWLTDQAMVKG